MVGLSKVAAGARSAWQRVAGMDERRRLLLLGVTMWTCLVLSSLNVIWSAWAQDQTYDESLHVAYARKLILTGDASPHPRGGPFLSKMPISMLNAGSERLALLLGYGESDLKPQYAPPRAVVFLGRLPNVIWLWLAAFAAQMIARRAAGRPAGYLAATAIALDANLVAHASLATVDAAVSALGLASLGALAAYAQRPTVRRASLVGLALGLVLLAKVTGGLIVLVGLVLAPLARSWRRAGPRATNRRRWKRAAQASALLAGALALATFIVCAGHAFHGVGAPVRALPAESAPMRLLHSLVPGLRIPLPAKFVVMYDHLGKSASGDGGGGSSPASGLRPKDRQSDPPRFLPSGRERGSWSYFPVRWVLKTPSLLALAIIVGLALVIARRRLLIEPTTRYLLGSLVLLLIYFLFYFHNYKGLRYLLPCIPIAYVVAAIGLAQLWRARWFPAVFGALVAFTLVEHTLYASNPISFTNLAVQPKTEVYRVLSDSDIDWDQNRHRVKPWLEARGIGPARLNPPHILPGVNVFQVNVVSGKLPIMEYRQDPYGWLRANLSASEHFRHTYLLYDVPSDTFDRFMREERTFHSHAAARARCIEGPGRPLTPGVAERIFRSERSVCLRVSEPSEVALVGETHGGRGWHGLRWSRRAGWLDPDGVCRWLPIDRGQQLRFRLEPGYHVLCRTGGLASLRLVGGSAVRLGPR